MKTPVRFSRCFLLVGFLFFLPFSVHAQEKEFRIGLIGLDTDHVIIFTRYINDPQTRSGCRVIAAYKGGSPDIPNSINRIDKFTNELRDSLGVELVESIPELCRRVDGILLESTDGRKHLEQAKLVFAAKKPVFIDKPFAADLSDVIEIYRLAKQRGVPCWSSSSLRFFPGIARMANSPDIGNVMGCDAFSPCPLEPHHSDLFWYGIHGVETLFTIMGTGCEKVQRAQTEGTDFVVGTWKDGRIGSFRGIRKGRAGYGASVFGSKGNGLSGEFNDYRPLGDRLIAFFKTGEVPVPPEATIEIYAFMAAADESKKRGGGQVTLEEMIKKASR
jgi:predicted dehydrogenase